MSERRVAPTDHREQYVSLAREHFGDIWPIVQWMTPSREEAVALLQDTLVQEADSYNGDNGQAHFRIWSLKRVHRTHRGQNGLATELPSTPADAQPHLGDLTDADPSNDGGNILRNPGTYALENRTPNNIRAEGNDWDTTLATTIDGLIDDFSDNSSYGVVDYSPLIGGVAPTGTTDGMLQLTGLSAVPMASGAELVFTLTSPADVQAQVLNIAGRPVASVLSGPAGAGLNRLSWNGTSDRGTAAPAGTYVVRVVARDSSGSQASALGTLRLKR